MGWIILASIMLLMLLIINLELFFPVFFRGNLIIQLKKPKVEEKSASILGWGSAILFFGFFFIFFFKEYKEGNPYTSEHYMNQMLLCVLWVINCIFRIMRAFKPIEIREKGIYGDNSIFFKFEKINSYTLKPENVLKLNYKSIFNKEKNYELNFKDQEDALRFDEALQNYVKKV